MVRRRQRERSVWEVVLPDADKLWPDALRRIDRLIDDEALVEVVAAALERRWPQRRRRGGRGTPAEVVMRMLVLKHLYRWSDAELEHEVRANLVCRAFARIVVRPIRARQRKVVHSAIRRRLGSWRINHLRPEFFTGK